MRPVLFEIFGLGVGSYGLFMLIGIVAAWVLIRILDKKKDKDVALVFLACVAGGLVGAFLFRPITRLPGLLLNMGYFSTLSGSEILSYLFGEIVFYGGLIGGVIAMLLCCKLFKIPFFKVADLFAPALALAHGFGRIGCFLGGCCFGVFVGATHPFAVIYPVNAILPPVGVPILAVQLIEAGSLFIIAAILITFYKNGAKTGYTVCLYGLLYSVLRFVLEFYRGDDTRGNFGLFSISQYISIALFISSIVLIYSQIEQQKEEEKQLGDK